MGKPVPTRPPATPDQRRLLREELHQIVNDIIDSWPTIDHQAALNASGYPTATLGSGTARTGTNTLVETSVLRRLSPESIWLTHLAQWINTGRDVHDELKRLEAASDQEVKELRERQNTVEVCTECGQPILGKVKRLDGQPHHHPDEQPPDTEGTCWWKAYNRLRGRR